MKRLVSIASASLLVVIVLLAAGCGGGGGNESSDAPAFSPGELSSLPTTNWITNGGSISNQRYSPLDQINTRQRRRSEGRLAYAISTAPASRRKYSGEAQPLFYDGVIYVVDRRQRRVRDRRRQRRDPLDLPREARSRRSSTVCCGWTNRGVALGDGQGLHRPARRQARRSRPADRRDRLDDVQAERLAGGLHASRARRCTTTASSSPALPAPSSASAAA